MANLNETGRLSLGQAAQAAGCSKRGFLEVLRSFGIPVFDHPAEELREEAES
jgi:predicted HTH domain antitoxin